MGLPHGWGQVAREKGLIRDAGGDAPPFVSVTVFVKTPNPLNGRAHWRIVSGRVKAIHAAVWSALFDVPVATRERLALGCTVTMTRVSAGEVDSDNLQACLKPARDTVACWMLDGKIGEKDSDPRLTWRYGQERGKRGVHCVRLTIEPRPAVARSPRP